MVAGGQGGGIGSADGPYGGGDVGCKPQYWNGDYYQAATQTSGYAFGTGQNGPDGDNTYKDYEGRARGSAGGGGLSLIHI